MYLRSFIPALSVAAILFFGSCTTSRNAVYFRDQKDGALDSTTIPQSVIQKSDLLGIMVSSSNAAASAQFNSTSVAFENATGTSSGTVGQTPGYLVDADGFIQFPLLGKLRAGGLTVNQLAEQISKQLLDRKQLVDPIVSVRFLNFKVTVLGEVKNPTVVNVPTSKITLLEALGLAGDLTIYGKRENVMVIRDENGARSMKRLNLNTSEIFASPYYFLRSGDIVYVEPNKAKVASSSRTGVILPIVFSALSFAAIVVDRINRD